MTSERRNHPRVKILGSLYGRLVALDVPITVEEISLGGMRIQTTIAFPVGSSHAFELALGNQAVVRLTGDVIHSGKVTGDREEHYLTGLRFTNEDPEVVADVMGRIT